jgi:hypothetical protein
MAISDCGTGSGGGSELCITDPCRISVAKVEYIEANSCIPASPSMAGRLVLALRCGNKDLLSLRCVR